MHKRYRNEDVDLKVKDVLVSQNNDTGNITVKAGACRYVSNQYTLFDSSRFSDSDCGSSAVKRCANKQTLFEEKH